MQVCTETNKTGADWGERNATARSGESLSGVGNQTSDDKERDNNSLVSHHTNGYPFQDMPELSQSFTELTKEGKNKDLILNNEHLKAFEDWKKALARTDVLTTTVIDGKMPFMIQADSSAHSVGACLAHDQPDGTERPRAIASFKLTPTHRNWSTIEREGYNYTVIFALRKFEIYVIGVSILIYTDHNPLQNVVVCSSKLARLIRWALRLQKFNIFTIIYCLCGMQLFWRCLRV